LLFKEIVMFHGPVDLYNLLLLVGISSLLVIALLRYIRPAISQVLQSLCDGNAMGTSFWLRAIDVMALSGTPALVLLLGGRVELDISQALRITLLCTLAGAFLTTAVLAISIWRFAVSPALLAAEYAAYAANLSTNTSTSNTGIPNSDAFASSATTDQTEPNKSREPIRFDLNS
jgi:hypothetical protein